MTTDLHNSLLSWFAAHARDLPWRETVNGKRDPYRVWVSEVLLQQTQVTRGRGYFERFMREFPTLNALADAPIEAVLKAWEGCGYYARARNLHKAATMAVTTGLPGTYDAWLTLPGVGAYTAAAIASIAFGEARAVNDGNVRRVLSRVFAQREPTNAWVQDQANALLFTPDPGRWNEALMDLGATVCTPRSPRCRECPIRGHCAAFASGEPQQYPAPKQRAPVKEVNAVVLLIGDDQQAYLETRTGSLLGGLSGLPLEVMEHDRERAALDRLTARLNAGETRFVGQVTHTMTHRHIILRVYAAEAPVVLSRTMDKPLAKLDQKVLSLFRQFRASLFES